MKLIIVKILFVLVLIIWGFEGQAQDSAPVAWSYQISRLENNAYALDFIADIDQGWVIYGMQKVENGPIPTSFHFMEINKAIKQGSVLPMTIPKPTIDELFGAELVKYHGKAVFRQIIEVEELPGMVSGYLKYMTCNGRKCLPPRDIDFTITIE